MWYTAARAITGDGRTVLSPVWINIEGELIVAITDKKPQCDSYYDLGDVTLTPGLINVHDHICRKAIRIPDEHATFGARLTALMNEDKSYLIMHTANNMMKYLTEEGITFVRDYGLGGMTSLIFKRAVREGIAKGPEIDTCGEPICMTGGHCYRQSYQADGVSEVMKAVRVQAQRGATIIKFMGSGGLEHFPKEDPTLPQYTIEELAAGVEVAKDLGLDTAIHAYSNEGIRRAVTVGINNIEHGAMMSEDEIEIMAEKKINFNPTMSGLRNVYKRGPNAYLKPIVQERVFNKQEEAMRKAKEYGILIGAGTDSGGFMYEEIELIRDTLRETPVEGIAHATGINAKIVKRDDIGLLGAGKRADVVAFKGNLVTSLENLNGGVVFTWKNGELFTGSAFTGSSLDSFYRKG